MSIIVVEIDGDQGDILKMLFQTFMMYKMICWMIKSKESLAKLCERIQHLLDVADFKEQYQLMIYETKKRQSE